MKVKKLLVILFTLSLLVCSAFAIGASAEGKEEKKLIYSYNISYEGDFKFMVAVPKAEVVNNLTFVVKDMDGNTLKETTKSVEQLAADDFLDPTLNGIPMWAIRSDFQISAKDMATEYQLVIITDADNTEIKIMLFGRSSTTILLLLRVLPS